MLYYFVIVTVLSGVKGANSQGQTGSNPIAGIRPMTEQIYFITFKRSSPMKYTYRPVGTCSQLMEVEAENNIVTSVKITGGCSGNGQGVSRLVEGMDIDTAISKMEGIRCGYKSTSCPDQLAQALKAMKNLQDA